MLFCILLWSPGSIVCVLLEYFLVCSLFLGRFTIVPGFFNLWVILRQIPNTNIWSFLNPVFQYNIPIQSIFFSFQHIKHEVISFKFALFNYLFISVLHSKQAFGILVNNKKDRFSAPPPQKKPPITIVKCQNKNDRRVHMLKTVSCQETEIHTDPQKYCCIPHTTRVRKHKNTHRKYVHSSLLGKHQSKKYLRCS